MEMTVTEPGKPTTRSARPITGDDARASMLRLLRSQVRCGRYRAEPEQVAEQVLAWHTSPQR